MSILGISNFGDIVTAIREELGISIGDTNAINKIKRTVNMIYLQEVVPFKRWIWLHGHTEIAHPNVYDSGTCAVTQNSTTVTLSTAPTSSLGSFTRYKFNVSGTQEVHTISTHTAESTTITLTSKYLGATNATVGFRIWPDEVALPTDCRETTEVWHNRYNQPMEALGFQEFRKISNTDGLKSDAFPINYTTTDFVDPSPSDSESESDRYRVMKIWPACTSTPVTISIDYIKEVSGLDSDSDEPIMPVSDYSVIIDGALARLWLILGRNPEQASIHQQLYAEKLKRMAGSVGDAIDTPIIAPKSRYMKIRRASRIGRVGRVGFDAGGEGTVPNITYLENVTINGGNFTGNMTAEAGVTIDGRDISTDGTNLDAHIAASSGVHGITGSVVGTTDTQTLTNKTITIISANGERLVETNASGNLVESNITSDELDFLNDVEELTSVTLTDNATTTAASWTVASFDSVSIIYSMTRGAGNIETGEIMLSSDGTNASIANSYTNLGTLGVTFSADIDSGSLRLRATTTSTGTDVTMKYKLHKWQA